MKTIANTCLVTVVIGSAIFATACSAKNPNACCTTASDCLKYGFDGITPCPGDQVCSPSGSCIVPACHTNSDCNDPTLMCDGYGQCVPLDPSQAQYTLKVQIAGSGAGMITSIPAGLTCTSGECSGTFDAGVQVQLTQVATAGAFLGWTSECAGTDACMVTMSADRRIGAIFGTKGEVLWAKPLDSSGLEWGHGTVTDIEGDVVAVGQFLGTLTAESVSLQSDGVNATSAYVMKLDGMTGKALWGKSLPVETATFVASDGTSFYVLGTFTGTVQLGTTTLSSRGLSDGFAAKVNATGEIQWAISFGGPGKETALGITVSNGTIGIVGTEPNGITIGNTTTPDSGSPQTGFVVGVDAATGAVKWSHVFAATGSTSLSRAAFAGANLLVGGVFSGTTSFGAANVTAIGVTDAFVASYDLDAGTLVKLDRWGNAGSSAGINAVTEDPAGHLIAVGTFSGSLTLGADTLSSSGTSAFVASFDGSTNLWHDGWSTTATGGSVVLAPSTVTASANELAIVGVFCNATLAASTTQLSGTACTVQNGFRTGFMIRMKNNGTTYVSVHSFGPVAWSDAAARATDGRLYVTGKAAPTLSLETGPVLVQSSDGQAAYVMAFAP